MTSIEDSPGLSSSLFTVPNLVGPSPVSRDCLGLRLGSLRRG